jgi:DNA (cytosine-5)-methyltransferase 1
MTSKERSCEVNMDVTVTSSAFSGSRPKRKSKSDGSARKKTKVEFDDDENSTESVNSESSSSDQEDKDGSSFEKQESHCDSKIKSKIKHIDSAKAEEKTNQGHCVYVVEPPERCDQCGQILDDSDLQLYKGDPDDALEEYSVLADERLSIFTGKEQSIEVMEVIQHKITNFSVYDNYLHLCPFDSGLIEAGIKLYISGSVKPIYDDNPTTEDSIPAMKLGPIGEWWITGYDGGKKALLGISTEFAEYILVNPSEEYRPIMQKAYEKTSIVKIVIEYLATSDDEESYEDLLHAVQTSVPPTSLDCTSFTEDMLLAHAQFVVEQVESYDVTADEDEDRYLARRCLKDLIKRSGALTGKRKSQGRRKMSETVTKKQPKHSMATTTPLVRTIFDTFFTGQIDTKPTGLRRRRCGVCEACQQPDCGKCSACRSMVKFGGSGRSKQACVKRRCPNMSLKDTEDDQIDTVDESDAQDVVDQNIQEMSPRKKLKARSRSKNSIQWVGELLKQEGNNNYYKQVKIDNDVISVGDTVSVQSEDEHLPIFIIQVYYMYEDSEGNKEFHGCWFSRGSDTILGETSDSNELFLIDLCDTNPITSIISKVNVAYQPPASDWAARGGNEEVADENKEESTDFFYQKWYDPEFARFEDPPTEYTTPNDTIGYCPSCSRLLERVKTRTPGLGETVSSSNEQTLYKSYTLRDETFAVGDCVYISPEAFKFKVEQLVSKKQQRKEVDESQFPEFYRKTDYVKGSNEDSPEPFRIGRIVEISTTNAEDPLSDSQIRLKVNKFFRPENTHLGVTAAYHADLNFLYWSEEVVSIKIDDVQGKCKVIYHEARTTINTSTLPLNTFYFSEVYDSQTETVSAPPAHVLSLYSKQKKKGKLRKASETNEPDRSDNVISYQHQLPLPSKLHSLDVFAGCGGLSEGFHQCGLSETKWAVEIDEPAAQAFRLNNPKSTVLVNDCNELLKLVMEGKEFNDKKQRLPKKGEVDLLCGGPPCQGFSGMNRFNSREYSQFKNSLVVSLLSYCDYYRPRYFVLENVRNFVSFKRSMVLKLTLRCLVRIGYQCTVAVLQAGSYGIPQSRRRY